jgi:hypothetical protein
MQTAGDTVRVRIDWWAPGQEAWIVMLDRTRVDLGKVDFVDVPIRREVTLCCTLVSLEAWHTDTILVYANRW